MINKCNRCMKSTQPDEEHFYQGVYYCWWCWLKYYDKITKKKNEI